MSHVISRRQTTFWEFTDEHRISRLHFLGKAKWHCSQEFIPGSGVLEEHAVLLDNAARWSGLYASAASHESATFLANVAGAMTALVDSWRPASHYLNHGHAHAVLDEGSGLLLRAPHPIVEAAKSVLKHHDALFGSAASWPKRACARVDRW